MRSQVRNMKLAGILRELSDLDPAKVAAVARRFPFDPLLAAKLEEDPRGTVASYKFADKLNDFLRNPKARPDLQTPEAQDFLNTIERNYHNERTDPLMPWLAREWKKGRIIHNKGPQYNDLRFDAGPDYEHENGRFHQLSSDQLNHWADWYHSDHPSRRGKDIMQMKTPDMHQTIQDWDQEMRENAQDQAQTRGEIVHSYPDGWTIQRLTEPQQLEDEGDAMGHCVGGYHNLVQGGHSMIYSLRDHNNTPHVTMEFTPNQWAVPPLATPENFNTPMDPSQWERSDKRTSYPVLNHSYVSQIRGNANTEPKDEYKRRIKDWMETMPESERPTYEHEIYSDMNDMRFEDPETSGREYGLPDPKDEYEWEPITHNVAEEYGGPGYQQYDADDLFNLAKEQNGLPEVKRHAENWIEKARQKEEEEFDNAFYQNTEPYFYDDFSRENPDATEEAYDQALQDWRDEQWRDWWNSSAASSFEDEWKSALARHQREEKGQHFGFKVARTVRPHYNWKTGEPCECGFTRHLDMMRTAKTRSLYHGTLIDHLPSIEAEGLRPQVGPWVENAYRDEYDRLEREEGKEPTGQIFREQFEPVVHATSKFDLNRALNAIRAQVGLKLDKPFPAVTRDDVMNHGVLLKHPGREGEPKNPQDANRGWNFQYEGEEGPRSAEPEDYYTRNTIPSSELVPITGPAMMRIFDRAGLRFETPEGRPRTPEWQERTTTVLVCEACGDPLDHGKCKRCDWGVPSPNAMTDADQNPPDPTRDMKPAIQS